MLSYILIIWPIVKLIDIYFTVNNKNFVKINFYSSLIFGIFSFRLIGLPPSVIFFIKVTLIVYITKIFGRILRLLLLLLSSFFIYAYSILILEGISLRKSRIFLEAESNYYFYVFFFLI
jgi:hypothetical protein